MKKFELHPMTFIIIGFIFVVLKITNVVSWPWLVVLLPFLIPMVAILVLILFVFLATIMFDR